jgi:hypothetical protein
VVCDCGRFSDDSDLNLDSLHGLDEKERNEELLSQSLTTVFPFSQLQSSPGHKLQQEEFKDSQVRNFNFK